MNKILYQVYAFLLEFAKEAKQLKPIVSADGVDDQTYVSILPKFF